MKIESIREFPATYLQDEVAKGGRFVHFSYTLSFLVSFKHTSGLYLIRSQDEARNAGLLYSLITLLCGWWGFPWGPKYTIASLRINLQGGQDVTDEVMSVVAGYVLYEETERKRIA